MAYPWLIYGVSVSGYLGSDRTRQIANNIVLFAIGKPTFG